jgi:DNA ligase-associated metallophosphoesterase
MPTAAKANPALEIDAAGARLALLPERAIWWPARSTLFIADVHLGKPASFARAGIPVPCGTAQADLATLSALVERSNAQRLFILGDLIHARDGRDDHTLAAFVAWRDRHAALAVTLIRGNHDTRAGDPPANWRVQCADPGLPDGPFELQHVPTQPAPGLFALAGHVHPAVTIAAPGCRRERAPCFLFGARGAILPAFGRFTGGKAVAPGPGERAFAIGPGVVLEVTPRPRPVRA